MHKPAKHQHPVTASTSVGSTPPSPETPTAPAAEAAPVSEVGAPPALTAAELETLKTEAAKHWDSYLRVTADFDNFRKRAARERQEAIAYANQDLLQKLLPVLDTFEAAATAAGQAQSDDAKAIQAGVLMIHQQLKNVLAQVGLEEINALGTAFDPTVHEAISQMESPDQPEGNVLHQTRRGYRLNGRLLRPASVVVAKSPTPTA